MPPLLAETPLSVEECTVFLPWPAASGSITALPRPKNLPSPHACGMPARPACRPPATGHPAAFSALFNINTTLYCSPPTLSQLPGLPGLPSFRGSLPEPRRAAIACIRATNTGIPVTQVSHQQPLSPKCSLAPPPFLVSQSWDASPARIARRMQHLRRRSCSRFV